MSIPRARLAAAVVCALLMGILSWPLHLAAAAEATLMIKARLVRCVSQNERKFMCDSESLCCEFIDGFDEDAAEAERLTSRLIPTTASIWISAAAPALSQSSATEH